MAVYKNNYERSGYEPADNNCHAENQKSGIFSFDNFSSLNNEQLLTAAVMYLMLKEKANFRLIIALGYILF